MPETCSTMKITKYLEGMRQKYVHKIQHFSIHFFLSCSTLSLTVCVLSAVCPFYDGMVSYWPSGGVSYVYVSKNQPIRSMRCTSTCTAHLCIFPEKRPFDDVDKRFAIIVWKPQYLLTYIRKNREKHIMMLVKYVKRSCMRSCFILFGNESWQHCFHISPVFLLVLRNKVTDLLFSVYT